MKKSAVGNVLSLHERCSSEHKQKDIKAAEDQKKLVDPLKEDRIAGHLGNGHGWMNGGGGDR